VLGPPRPGRAPVLVHRQGERPGDVLRQRVDQGLQHRVSRVVGGLRDRVQLPGLAQLDDDLAGGLCPARGGGRERLGLGGERRPPVWDAMDGEAHAAPRHGAVGAAHHALQPERRAPPLLLVDQRRGARLRRHADPLPHEVHRVARLCRRRHLAGGFSRDRQLRPEEPHLRPGLALCACKPRGVHGDLASAHQRRRRALRPARGTPGQEDLVVGGGRRCARLAAPTLRRLQRLRGDPGGALPRPGDVRLPAAAGCGVVSRVLDAAARDRGAHADESQRGVAPGGGAGGSGLAGVSRDGAADAATRWRARDAGGRAHGSDGDDWAFARPHHAARRARPPGNATGARRAFAGPTAPS
jgi:hypothetical protein